MTLDEITAKLKSKFQYAKSFGHTVLFDFGDDGQLLVDATQSPPEFTVGEGEAEVTLAANIDVFDRILEGTQDPNMAFMMGKLKVRGSMGLALKLNGILEG